jgi:hypothetical protein
VDATVGCAGDAATTEVLSLPDCAYRTMPTMVRITPPKITTPAICPRRTVLPMSVNIIGGPCVVKECRLIACTTNPDRTAATPATRVSFPLTRVRLIRAHPRSIRPDQQPCRPSQPDRSVPIQSPPLVQMSAGLNRARPGRSGMSIAGGLATDRGRELTHMPSPRRGWCGVSMSTGAR